MINLKTLTKMEMALLIEAERQLRCWWPSDVSTFWVTRVALLAVLGARVNAELLGVSPSGYAETVRMLDHFNASACLTKAAIIPHGC